MKTEIINRLREKKDFVSGQELCDHFGVSRTAVWKTINQLKKEGYEIEAVPNRGYRLLDAEDVFGAEEIKSYLTTKWVARSLDFYKETASTNILAKQAAEDGLADGTLIVADMQTAGRGRRGRSWNSPAGTNIYFTLMLRPKLAPGKASMLTIVMAHAVTRAINELTGLSCTIKWPNDVVHNGRKMVGILTEMSAEQDYIHHVVIGVGINVREQVFAPEIADKACCIDREWGRKISRSRLLAQIMNVFEEDYEIFMRDGDLSGLQESYNDMLVNRDRIVCILSSRPDEEGRQAEEFRGTALGIDREGELLVRREDGSVEKVFAGEVSVRGVYGYV